MPLAHTESDCSVVAAAEPRSACRRLLLGQLAQLWPETEMPDSIIVDLSASAGRRSTVAQTQLMGYAYGSVWALRGSGILEPDMDAIERESAEGLPTVRAVTQCFTLGALQWFTLACNDFVAFDYRGLGQPCYAASSDEPYAAHVLAETFVTPDARRHITDHGLQRPYEVVIAMVSGLSCCQKVTVSLTPYDDSSGIRLIDIELTCGLSGREAIGARNRVRDRMRGDLGLEIANRFLVVVR